VNGRSGADRDSGAERASNADGGKAPSEPRSHAHAPPPVEPPPAALSPKAAPTGQTGPGSDAATEDTADTAGRDHEQRHTRQVSAFPGHRDILPWPYPGPGTLPAVHTTRRRPLKVIGRTVSKAWSDSLFRLSAEGAFWSALSTAPLLLALLGLVGFVGRWFGPDAIDAVQNQVLVVLHGIFSSEVVDNLLSANVGAMLHNGQADLVSVGFFISLWAGSSAISAFVESITIAYGQYEVRHPVSERLFALGLYLIALITGTVTLPLLAIGPEALTKLFPPSIREQASTVITVAYYPGMVAALVLLLTTLYKVAPRHKHPWRRGIPGALLATAVFVVASSGLRIYVSYVYTHGLTYGALATPITFLLFYYMMSLAIVLGAQFNNATLEYYPARVTRRELRKWQRFEPAASEGVSEGDRSDGDRFAGDRPDGDGSDEDRSR
jgi:membrane protein